MKARPSLVLASPPPRRMLQRLAGGRPAGCANAQGRWAKHWGPRILSSSCLNALPLDTENDKILPPLCHTVARCLNESRSKWRGRCPARVGSSF